MLMSIANEHANGVICCYLLQVTIVYITGCAITRSNEHADDVTCCYMLQVTLVYGQDRAVTRSRTC